MENLNLNFMLKPNRFEASEFHHIKNILSDVEQGKYAEKVMTQPPVKPKGGSVIVYIKNSSGDREYMRDHCFCFQSKGKTTFPKFGIGKEYRRLALPVEGKGRVSVDFWKDIYFLTNPTNRNREAVLIHYIGDEKLFVPNPHLNSKSDQPYIRTSNVTMKKLASMVGDRFSKPKFVYECATKQTARDKELNTGEEIYSSRNVQQVTEYSLSCLI
jgi:hypothetical protein